MPQLGYSPLPENLSQEIANAVGRLTGQPEEKLNRGNCANPRFAGSLGAGSKGPRDPYETIPDDGRTKNGNNNGGGGGGGNGGGTSGGGGGNGGPGSGPGEGGATDGGSGGGAGGPDGGTGGLGDGSVDGGGLGESALGPDGLASPVAGLTGGATPVGGGSSTWRAAEPGTYGAVGASSSRWPLVGLIACVVVPAALTPVWRKLKSRRALAAAG